MMRPGSHSHRVADRGAVRLSTVAFVLAVASAGVAFYVASSEMGSDAQRAKGETARDHVVNAAQSPQCQDVRGVQVACR